MVGHLNWLSYLLMNTAISGELIYNPNFYSKAYTHLVNKTKNILNFTMYIKNNSIIIIIPHQERVVLQFS